MALKTWVIYIDYYIYKSIGTVKQHNLILPPKGICSQLDYNAVGKSLN